SALSQTPDRVLSSDTPIFAVSFLEGGKSIAGAGAGQLRVWDAATGAALTRLEPAKAAFEFLPHAGQVAQSVPDGTLEILALPGGKPVRRVPAVSGEMGRPAFARDGGSFARAYRTAPGASETMVRVRDLDGRPKFAVPAGLGGISVMSFSPDGRFLVAASNDTDIRVWNAQSGELVRLIGEMKVTMFALAFSPDGKWLALAGADRIVYLYDTANWKLARTLTGQPEMISALAFSPDGRRLVTGGFSELTVNHPVKIMLWDVASGTALRSMDAPRVVSSAVFSPDGRTIAAACGQKTVSLFKAAE
ncbi:MAG TPA: hypothetical protein DEH78_09625, partial [Solibacterales bacterium]|nr:hypothetical protein [Bryobacterales bacterium]